VGPGGGGEGLKEMSPERLERDREDKRLRILYHLALVCIQIDAFALGEKIQCRAQTFYNFIRFRIGNGPALFYCKCMIME
jgi:hypothetical protein